MIIPSIDIMGGQAVQLVGGKEKAIDAGDPLPLAEKFRVAGEIALIDLDAAMGSGSNESLIRQTLRAAPCRFGGGIRDVETAVKWLDAGAQKIILGTKAVPEILSQLPRERLIAAADADQGEVVVEGWQQKTGVRILEKIASLRDYVSGFLVTFVEREGRLLGTNMEQVAEIVAAAKPARVTIAGGVSSAQEIASLDHLGADAQVGMALYTGKMRLADAITSPLKSDRPDGLWPTVVCDEFGCAIGLAYSSAESVRLAVAEKRGVYHSRERGIWRKGETSGAVQELMRIDLDCDRDTLRFIVRQQGSGFCHQDTFTCWGADQGIYRLFRCLEKRKEDAPEGSYTRRLLTEQGLLSSKLLEEAKELVAAQGTDETCLEAADLLYFLLVTLVQRGIKLEQVEKELDLRSLKVTRRPGNAKA